MTAIIPPEKRDESDLDRLGARAAELEAVLGARGEEIARMKAGLHAFKLEYHRRVGSLHEQLEQLELDIAEAELGELSKKVANGPSDLGEPGPGARPEPPPRFTSDAVRRLFRDVAKVVHPDLARDASARDRRHTLMVEANRAYALGDAAQLRWILEAWEKSPEAVSGSDPAAMRLRLARRVAEIEGQLDALGRELDRLTESPVWKLKAMVDEAASRGKDLVGETIARLQRDITVATNRLDAMRPPR